MRHCSTSSTSPKAENNRFVGDDRNYDLIPGRLYRAKFSIPLTHCKKGPSDRPCFIDSKHIFLLLYYKVTTNPVAGSRGSYPKKELLKYNIEIKILLHDSIETIRMEYISTETFEAMNPTTDYFISAASIS